MRVGLLAAGIHGNTKLLNALVSQENKVQKYAPTNLSCRGDKFIFKHSLRNTLEKGFLLMKCLQINNYLAVIFLYKHVEYVLKSWSSVYYSIIQSSLSFELLLSDNVKGRFVYSVKCEKAFNSQSKRGVH